MPTDPAPRFTRVARAEELAPGAMKRVLLEGRRVLLARVAGDFYAVDDTCTHEDASLSCGALRGHLVRCPLHGSRFDLRTGAVQEEPAEEDLRTYPVRVEAGEVWVGVA